MYNIELIGERIKQVRKELDMTLEDVANKIGVAKSTIQRQSEDLNRHFSREDMQIKQAQEKMLNVTSHQGKGRKTTVRYNFILFRVAII